MPVPESRLEYCRRRVLAFLEARYTPPRGLSDSAKAENVAAIADFLARRLGGLADGQFEALVGATLERTAERHAKFTWPAQGAFAAAVPEITGGSRVSDGFSSDDKRLAAQLAAGDPVAETTVWGITGMQLVDLGLISREIIDRYRDGTVRRFAAFYRGDAVRMLRERFGVKVEPYLRSAGLLPPPGGAVCGEYE
jgi:hypothetical protein